MSKSLDVENSGVVAQGETALPAPQGIGMAVAFEWGLAAQFVVLPFIQLGLGLPPLVKFTQQGLVNALLTVLISLPIIALLAVFGEGLRRGWRWMRPVQIVVSSLASLGGIVTLFTLWKAISVGNYWPIITTVILLGVSPFIVWRLSRPATARWFATVTSAEARKRHGGSWPWFILIWAIVGCALQMIATHAH